MGPGREDDQPGAEEEIESPFEKLGSLEGMHDGVTLARKAGKGGERGAMI